MPESEEKANVPVACLLCWTEFVTSQESLDRDEVECPSCHSNVIRAKVTEGEEGEPEEK